MTQPTESELRDDIKRLQLLQIIWKAQADICALKVQEIQDAIRRDQSAIDALQEVRDGNS